MRDKLNFNLYGEAFSKVSSIAKKQGVLEEDVIKKALALYIQIKNNKVIDTSHLYVKDKKGNMFKINI